MDDADGIGQLISDEMDQEQLTAVELSQDTDEFMKKALEEALSEARTKSPDASNPNSILNDAEMMEEINAVFDKANEQLLESIAEIREEQRAMTKANSDARAEAMRLEEERLAEAEGSVSRLVEKVRQETLEVEKAKAELQEQQEKLLDDPLMKMSDLKNAGPIKKGALVGALL